MYLGIWAELFIFHAWNINHKLKQKLYYRFFKFSQQTLHPIPIPKSFRPDGKVINVPIDLTNSGPIE